MKVVTGTNLLFNIPWDSEPTEKILTFEGTDTDDQHDYGGTIGRFSDGPLLRDDGSPR